MKKHKLSRDESDHSQISIAEPDEINTVLLKREIPLVINKMILEYCAPVSLQCTTPPFYQEFWNCVDLHLFRDRYVYVRLKIFTFEGDDIIAIYLDSQITGMDRVTGGLTVQCPQVNWNYMVQYCERIDYKNHETRKPITLDDQMRTFIFNCVHGLQQIKGICPLTEPVCSLSSVKSGWVQYDNNDLCEGVFYEITMLDDSDAIEAHTTSKSIQNDYLIPLQPVLGKQAMDVLNQLEKSMYNISLETLTPLIQLLLRAKDRELNKTQTRDTDIEYFCFYIDDRELHQDIQKYLHTIFAGLVTSLNSLFQYSKK
jgi:hypothetical protein